VFAPTGSRRDAAGVIFNLPGYRVIEAVDLPLGGRRVTLWSAGVFRTVELCYFMLSAARLGIRCGPLGVR
jgi:hypothetical protein